MFLQRRRIDHSDSGPSTQLIESHNAHSAHPKYQAVPNHESEDDPVPEKNFEENVSRRVLTLPPRKTKLCLLALLLVASSMTLYFHVHRSSWHGLGWFDTLSGQDEGKVVHHSTIPTLFSLVDPDTETFLYALDNELYQQLKTARIITNAEIGTSTVELNVDKTHIHYQESLVVSWTERPSRVRATPRVADDSILAFVCTNQHGSESEKPKSSSSILRTSKFEDMLDAATIRQVRATSNFHKRRDGLVESSLADNEWYIPSFPVARFDMCQFLLLEPLSNKDSSVDFQLLAQSSVLYPSSTNRPTAIHLAFTSNPTEMLVNFVTGTAGTPIVTLLSDGEKDTSTFLGSTTSYTAEDLCQAPANETEPGKFQTPGFLHSVLVTGLETDTVYSYKVGLKGGQGTVFSDAFEFRSALSPGPFIAPFSWLVYGDQGCPSSGWGEGGALTAAMTAREIDQANQENSERLPIRSVHHIGDLSYAQGAAHVWDDWFEMIQVFATKVPLMIAIGNHEYDHTYGGEGGKDPSGIPDENGFMPIWGNFRDDSGGECGVPTAKRFTMPQSPSNTSNGVFWYSHEFANVHTTVISSEHDLSRGTPQYTWLENDLRSVNRARTPWLILESHRPLYESEAVWEQNSVGIAMRYEIEDLLRDYNVDLVVAGHYHAYHRSCDGLYRSKCNSGGPTHITVGSAGAHFDEAVEYDNNWTEQLIEHEYGYGRITVANESALQFEFVKAGRTDDPAAGDTLDSVWLIRQR